MHRGFCRSTIIAALRFLKSPKLIVTLGRAIERCGDLGVPNEIPAVYWNRLNG